MNLGLYWVLGLLILPTLLHAYPCDNSRIIIKNQTDITFKIDAEKPLSGTELISESSKQTHDLSAQSEIRYRVHAGRMTWGESLGTITLSSPDQQYELFYLFGHMFGLGRCTVRYDVTQKPIRAQSKNNKSPIYLIDCDDTFTDETAHLTCVIKSNVKK